VTSDEPPVVDPINGWVTGGDGICRQRWSFTASSLVTPATVKVEECGGAATMPAAYLREPHLMCVDCHAVALDSPGWKDLSDRYPPE
jgi:hypothetical protein